MVLVLVSPIYRKPKGLLESVLLGFLILLALLTIFKGMKSEVRGMPDLAWNLNFIAGPIHTQANKSLHNMIP